MSKLIKSHPLLATVWSSNIRDVLFSVGLSRGTSVNCGSKYPRVTRRALGLHSLPCAFASVGSRGLRVKIHLHLKTWSAGIWSRRIRETVPVFNQLLISPSWAASNWHLSSGWSEDNRTSARCFLPVVASSSQFDPVSMAPDWNCWFMSNSTRQHISGSSMEAVSWLAKSYYHL